MSRNFLFEHRRRSLCHTTWESHCVRTFKRAGVPSQLIELQKSARAPPGRLRATLKPPRSRGYQCTVNAAALGIRENIRRSEDMATRLRLKLRALEQELDVSVPGLQGWGD